MIQPKILLVGFITTRCEALVRFGQIVELVNRSQVSLKVVTLGETFFRLLTVRKRALVRQCMSGSMYTGGARQSYL